MEMARRDDQRVRLRDVAARAGVSVGSASQAFGRPELVSKEVRERVLAAAEELGYAGPDPTARRLRTGRAGALGLIGAKRRRASPRPRTRTRRGALLRDLPGPGRADAARSERRATRRLPGGTGKRVGRRPCPYLPTERVRAGAESDARAHAR